MFCATFYLVTRGRTSVIFGTLKGDSLKLMFYHQSLVPVTETSSKMASTLCQKRLTILCQKAQNFCIIRTIRFCSNFTSI